MKSTPLIKQLQEDGAGGAVGAASVASAATPLFASMVRRTRIPKIKVHQYSNKPTKKRKLGLGESFKIEVASIKEASELDASGVISKLKGLEKQDQHTNQPLATFGLEDENGNLVKVSVPLDQGNDFEKALQSSIQPTDDTTVEIAELLFDLKDRFDIVDVDWGDVVEDEEDVVPQEGEVPVDGEVPPEDLAGADELPPEEDTSSVASLLTQVIDMMKADADARKADAKAREADAEAKEAEYISLQAASKVRQEEQILDMESHEKKQKEVSKEAKRLAKLAKWKHDLADENDTEREDMDQLIPSYTDVVPVEPETVEDEENTTSSLAAFLLKRLSK
jgi:hypothetical protein